MGSSQSTPSAAGNSIEKVSSQSYPEKMPDVSAVSGQKKSTDIVLDERNVSTPTDEDDGVSVTSSEDFYSSDEESDDGEGKRNWALEDSQIPSSSSHIWLDPAVGIVSLDEEWNERLQILQDAKNLRMVADHFLHPEKPVVTTDAFACGRNWFSRPSGDEYLEEDDADDRDDILADMKELKAQAEAYLMPEKPVKVDSLATCSNYFDRMSIAEPTESANEEEARMVLADCAELKRQAVQWMAPEAPVVTTDAFATGRNYFSRPSAPEGVDEEEQERLAIIAEAAALKNLAVDYLHPESPVVTSDPCACGRNYFTRASAPEYLDEDDADDLEDAAADLRELKIQAERFYQPEKPVEVDPLMTCRNYFERSVPTESLEDAEERAQILAEAQVLKKLATDYMHPELPVVTTDPCATARSYFSRPSAENVDKEEEEERAQILAEAQQLKGLATDYMHPERPVVTLDPTAMGRNYFSKASAPEQDDEEQRLILEEMKQLKALATDYMHPELPVTTTDPSAMGRCYFSRASAPEQESEDYMDDREDILDDLVQLKAQAEMYMMPEKPVEVDPISMGRSFFERPSAPRPEDADEAEERKMIIKEAGELRRLATDYLCPELPVTTTDPFATGRNYFNRASAEHEDDDVDLRERKAILADAQSLKQKAIDYLQPELPVVTTDVSAMGRNWYSRLAADEYEDAKDERSRVLLEAAALKQTAVDFLQPERGVVTSDACATGRNYFKRASAAPYEDAEESEERQQALADAQQMSKVAKDYLAPGPIDVDAGATARCYFDRPGARGHEDHIHTQGHSLSHGQVEHGILDYHGHDANYYHSHHHDDHSIQSGHFDMDESTGYDDTHLYQDIRQSLQMTEPFKGEHPKEADEEGNLSRSPSCVMLFEEAAM